MSGRHNVSRSGHEKLDRYLARNGDPAMLVVSLIFSFFKVLAVRVAIA
jgi:hypothetical protein